jgi:hypothetical protein
MIVGSICVYDQKLYSLMQCIAALKDQVSRLYLNIQTSDPLLYSEVLQYCHQQGTEYDVWNVQFSTWRPARRFDQDNKARLAPIIMARNMAIDYATAVGADHLLFVDSDVIIPSGSVIRLIGANRPIVGGVVPGRGVHRHARYIFGEIEPVESSLIRCTHGTCGFVLLQQSVFSHLRFRHGPHPDSNAGDLAEDPCYAADAKKLGLSDGWYIRTDLLAEHLDDPHAPLTEAGAINDYHA